MRWRVRLSKRKPNWTYFAVTVFVDAETPAQAAAMAEQQHIGTETTAEAYETVPATPAMESAHVKHRQRVQRWIELARVAKAGRGHL